MTGYRPEDLEGWEFKIIRSATRVFADRTKMQAILDEESQAGWEMVEKFDDQRIRLKRSADRRSMDGQSEIDPYRTNVGTSQALIVVLILVGLVGVLGAIGLMAAIAAK